MISVSLDTLSSCHSTRTAKRYDLLDANESTWTFVALEHVGCVKYLLVRGLAALAARER
jgi:hypothetical protein